MVERKFSFVITLLFIFALFNFNLTAKTTTELQNEVIELYVGTFKRAPDKKGLDYWLKNMEEKNWTMETVATSFFDQKETKSKYEGLNTTDFINQVYLNVLNRKADAKGLEYWKKKIDSGEISREKFIIAIINGAKSPTGGAEDRALLENKKNVSRYFALTLGLNDPTLAKRVLAPVTSDGNSTNIVKTAMKYFAFCEKHMEFFEDNSSEQLNCDNNVSEEFFGWKGDGKWSDDAEFFADNDFFMGNVKIDINDTFLKDVNDTIGVGDIELPNGNDIFDDNNSTNDNNQDTTPINQIKLCDNKVAYLRDIFQVTMRINESGITGGIFEKIKEHNFVGVAFCGTFANTNSSADVLNSLKQNFASALSVTYKENSDGSIIAQYEMRDKNIQAYALLRTILKGAGVGDFDNYPDFTSYQSVKDFYIDLYIKYIGSNRAYVIIVITDKSKDERIYIDPIIDGNKTIITPPEVDKTNSDVFTHKDVKGKADILFVMDDSGSMRQEQTAASMAIIRTFSKAIANANLDWKATVIGTERRRNYMKYVNNPSLNDIKKLARQLRLGTYGWDEVGIKKAYDYLKNGAIKVREGAKLSIVYLSDEICHTRLSELGINDANNSYFVKNNIPVHVVIPTFLMKEKNLAYKISKLTGGVVANLTNYKTGYDAMMQKLVSDAAGKASPIILSKKTVIPATIKVFVNNKELPFANWRYNVNSNSISILGVKLNDGDEIRVTYKY